MKKKLSLIFSSLALLLVMIVTLCACSSYSSIKSAYTKEGYEEIEISKEYKDKVTDMFGEDVADTLTIHVLKLKVADDANALDKAAAATSTVIIAEFKSTKELEEQMKKHVTEEDEKKISEAIQKLDTVSGNCVYVFSLSQKSFDIFKSTKK
ncbi:MAG: hypothetical protein K2L02_01015 [Clostridia bacterium]|nr:hypothetical protein [Clostridia bacterium]